MNCPRCSTPIPPPADLTQRSARCPSCGTQVDLATDAGATTVRPPVPPTAPAGDDPWIGRSIASGRYTIESLLGAGGMGRVYRARQTALGRAVAVKILSPELARDEGFRRRFEREAGTLAALEHPRIVTVHDVGVEGDVPYIVMALVVGPKGAPVSLRDLLDAGTVEEELALRIIQETCAALEYAHGRGVIHRDIKPGNILLDAEGHAKIADFGIARVAGASDAAHLTTTGTVLGTMRYMAPEQLADAARADARSDLYSLGVVFYEMLTGHSPVGRFELPSEVRAGLDHRLDAIVDRALRRAASQRYASAGEMARDLSRITTEREYGRLQGIDPAGAGTPVGTKGVVGSGGAGGRDPSTSSRPTGFVAASAAASVPASSTPSAPSSSPASPDPATSRPPPPPASSAPAPRPAPVSSRRALLGTVLALAVLGGGLGLFFVTRSPASSGGASVGTGVPPKPDPAPAPPLPGSPSPAPPLPAVPPPKPKPGPSLLEQAGGKVAPPAVDPGAGKDVPPPPPVPSAPNLAKGDGGLPATGGATAAEVRLLEAARTKVLERLEADLLGEETYADLAGSLPASGSAEERQAAQQAVEVQLGRWKAGRTLEVAAAIPNAILARVMAGHGMPADEVREAVAATYAETIPRSWKLRGAQSIGHGFVVVLYDATMGEPDTDDELETRVAVGVLEGSAWKVFP